MKCLKVLALSICAISLLGCSDRERSSASRDGRPVVNPGGVSGFNYTPHYIVGFGIRGENGMRGGGPNIRRSKGEGPAGGGKETCCIGIPEVWTPGMKVTIRWEVEKVPDGVTPGIHYRAEARIPQYAPETGGMWAIFLPNDRVKVMVNDGNASGQNNLNERPADDDPYVAQGVIDEEANREAAEHRCKYPILPTDCPERKAK